MIHHGPWNALTMILVNTFTVTPLLMITPYLDPPNLSTTPANTTTTLPSWFNLDALKCKIHGSLLEDFKHLESDNMPSDHHCLKPFCKLHPACPLQHGKTFRGWRARFDTVLMSLHNSMTLLRPLPWITLSILCSTHYPSRRNPPLLYPQQLHLFLPHLTKQMICCCHLWNPHILHICHQQPYPINQITTCSAPCLIPRCLCSFLPLQKATWPHQPSWQKNAPLCPVPDV